MMVIKVIRGLLLGTLLGTIYMSCATEVIKFNPRHTAPNKDLEVYRKDIQFISKGKLGTKDYTMGFIKAPKDIPNLLGVCTFTLNNFSKEIDIVESAWYSLSSDRKLLLVAHEFKHCECNMYYHTTNKFSDGCPKDFMSEFISSEKCIEDHRDDYVDDIRRGCDD